MVIIAIRDYEFEDGFKIKTGDTFHIVERTLDEDNTINYHIHKDNSIHVLKGDKYVRELSLVEEALLCKLYRESDAMTTLISNAVDGMNNSIDNLREEFDKC